MVFMPISTRCSIRSLSGSAVAKTGSNKQIAAVSLLLMLNLRVLLLLLISVSVLPSAYAQRSRVTKSRHQYSLPRVKGDKAKIVCPVFTNSRYPIHSLGIKAGDPFALTYKLYPNKRWSFVLDVGKAASGLYREYFRDQFDGYVAGDTLGAESRMAYVSHRVKSDFVAEAKLLYQVDASRIANGLQFYAGVGWEIKKTSLRYEYERQPAPDGYPFGSFDRNRSAMGPQISAGIEYAYFTVPIIAFMEVEYFTDIQLDPGWSRFEGGVGLRYVF